MLAGRTAAVQPIANKIAWRCMMTPRQPVVFCHFPFLVSYLFYYLPPVPRYIQQGKNDRGHRCRPCCPSIDGILGYIFRYLIESGQITDLDDAGEMAAALCPGHRDRHDGYRRHSFGNCRSGHQGFATWVSEIKVK